MKARVAPGADASGVVRRPVRLVALALGLALLITVFPPAGQVIVHAHPQTLSEELTDLKEIEVVSETVEAAPAAHGSQVTATPAVHTDADGARATFAATPQAGPEVEVVAAEADPGSGVSRSQIVEPELTFNMLGVIAPASASALRARTADDEGWSEWTDLELYDEEDGPDLDSAEHADSEGVLAGRVATQPLWVGEADRLQIEVEGAKVGELNVTLIDSMGSSGGPTLRTYETTSANQAHAAGALELVSRAAWGADESLRNGSPRYASKVHMGVVHHTAHTTNLSLANSYSRAEAPGLIRAMYRYHTQSLGWADLGYNVVIDRFGTVYEGRAGGFERGVIGAHAANFNTGSFGVSVIGNFLQSQAPEAALSALEKVIGIKSAIHGIDPQGWTDRMGSTPRPTIVGHRDVGSTSCPGRIHDVLPRLRSGATKHSVRFPDVLGSSAHRAAILALAEAGVTQGCEANLYCPREVLNRAQASSFVMRALQVNPVAGTQFSDVRPDYVHAPAINALAQRNWLWGYDDGSFRPAETMTRGQLASLLYRSLELPPPVSRTYYPDVRVDHPHAEGINALYEAGIRGDCGGGGFCPDDDVLRDSTASFVSMVLNYRNNTSP